MPQSIRWGTLLTASTWDKLFLSCKLSSKVSHDSFSKLFSYLHHWLPTRYTLAIPYTWLTSGGGGVGTKVLGSSAGFLTPACMSFFQSISGLKNRNPSHGLEEVDVIFKWVTWVAWWCQCTFVPNFRGVPVKCTMGKIIKIFQNEGRGCF